MTVDLPERRRGRRIVRIGSTAILGAVALFVAYLGIGVALVMITTSGDIRAIAGGMAYALTAFGAPVATALYLSRRCHWDGLRAARLGIILVLLIHVALLPYAFAVFAM